MKLVKAFILAFVIVGGFVPSYAEEIPVHLNPSDGKSKDEVPVTGDYDKDSKELALKFSESSVYDVAVSGPEGIVFSAKVDVKTYHEVRVRVSAYDGEAYTVVVTDSQGRVYEGDFFA